MPYVITKECNQCDTCLVGCESGAVQEGPDNNTIDITICIECGICAANCPFQAIVFEEETGAQSPS
jgi:ferredoxin